MTRIDVQAPPPTRATDGLALDTELLSASLNQVLEEQAGRVFASRVQWLFRTAAAVRAGDEAAIDRLVTYLRDVSDESVEPIIRACSLELQLANIAEERERVRRRRQYDATGEIQRESLAQTAQILRERNVDISPLTSSLQIEHVLTAHPTEATRRSVLDHQWDVAALLDKLDDPRTGNDAPARAAGRAARGADRLVADRRAAPRAPEGRGRGPAQPVLLRGGAVRRGARRCWTRSSTSSACGSSSRCLSYGSWTGGDMDGHPEVGADTLASALQLHRNTALRLLRERVDHLARVFSHSSLRVPMSAGARGLAGAGRRGAPAAPPSCAARTTSGSRCGPSSASSRTG